MSKYREFQQRFVELGQQHHLDADACFDAVEQLTRQLIADSGWYSDDVEFIHLTQPFSSGRPSKALRFNRVGRNRDRIRDVASMTQGLWSLGLRFRLKPHLSVAFQPQEVMFVLPVRVGQHPDQASGQGSEQECPIAIQIEPDCKPYTPEEFAQLSELVWERIEKVLEQGIPRLIKQPEQAEEFQNLGIVLDSETLSSLGIELKR